MKLAARIALLSLAAAAFAGLTDLYGNSANLPLPNPQWRAVRSHQASWPRGNRYPSAIGEFIGELIGVTVCAVAGRVVFRLRLSPASPSEGKMTALNLHRH